MKDRLIERRKSKGWERKEAAHNIEIDYQYLYKLEKGTNEPPAWEILVKLAKGLETSTDYLLGLTSNPALPEVLNTSAHSETITELIDVALDMSDSRRREILAVARALAAMEQQESTPLQKAIKKVVTGENPPLVIGGEEAS